MANFLGACGRSFTTGGNEIRATLLLHRYPLLWAAAALILGAKLEEVVPESLLATVAFISLMLCLLLVSKARLLQHRSSHVLLLCMLTFLTCLGAWRGRLARPPHADSLSAVATRKAEPIAARVVIESAAVWRPNPNYRMQDPTSQPWKTQWNIRLASVRDCNGWKPADAKSSLQCEGRIDEFFPGDLIEIHGNYRRIHEPTNPGAFDFSAQSQKLGRFVLFSVDGRQQIGHIGTRREYWLPRLRGLAVRQVDRTLRRWVGNDQAPLAAALVFGQREQVDWQDQQELMATGTLHMLAISGMHVEVVAWGFLLLCAVVPVGDRVRLLSLIAICGLYAALADGKPPVIRAVILVALFELSRCLGRRGRLVNLLSLAAIALFLLRANNIDNVGVHLSFLAVAAIGVFVIEDSKQPNTRDSALKDLILETAGPARRWALLAWQWTRNMVRLSFWVWLITCPLVWTSFHIVAPVSIPLNVLIAIPLTISLLSGLITGVFGWFAPVGWLAGTVCGSGLTIVSWLVDCGQNIRGGHLWLPSPPGWWTAIFYLVCVGWLLILGKERRSWLAVGLVIWLVVGISYFAFGLRGFLGIPESVARASEEPGLKVTFLDVGHGTSVIIQEPGGRVSLYDAGHLGAPERSHQEIAAALWDLGTARIDTLILSHADADHYNATQGLLERFTIGRVVSTPEFWQSEDRHVTELVNYLHRNQVKTLTWKAGDAGAHGNFQWKVLHPPTGNIWESDNASSLCLLMDYNDRRILLPGDLEGSGLRSLTQLPERPCHALMAPHHGSLAIDPQELLAWCRPELVVVSGNHRAVRPQVIEKYAMPSADLGITFRDGAIEYRVSPTAETSIWHWSNRRWESIPHRQEITK